MRKILLLVIVSSITLYLPSCIGITNITAPQTVALNQGNFKFVKSVSAETEAVYILGIGGFGDNATADIVEKLREEAQLQSNQALADIRIKTTTKNYLCIVIKRTLTASATVVEFRDIETNSFINRTATEIIEEEVVQTPKSDKDSIAITEAIIEQPLAEEKNIDEKAVIEENSSEIKDDKDFSIEYSIERLEKIKNSLLGGNVENKEKLKEDVKNIRRWYNGISLSSSEIDNLLKEIKKLLKD